MLGTGYFLKIAKINSQREKPICPNRKNQFPQKFRQSTKINFRKNFVPHGISDVCKREFTKEKTMRDGKMAKSKCDIVPNEQTFVDELKFNSR